MASKTVIWAILFLVVFGDVVVEGQDSTTVATDAASLTTREPVPNIPEHSDGGLEDEESRVTTSAPAVPTTTIQTDQCDSNPCQNGGECFSNDAGYRCFCPEDWHGDNCEKSKPCSVNPCLNDGICQENGDDFICTCPKGWKGDTCETEVVDPCQPNPCKRGICTPDRANPETSTCNCPNGWTGLTCSKDVDECQNQPCGPRPNRCINRPGNFICICGSGYEAKGTTCVDTNECRTIHDCDHICENTQGSYRCKCRAGFSLGRNKKTCTDIDECDDWTWNKGPCEYDCENTAGSYKCSCKEGYKLDKDGHGCVDINECGAGNGGCDQYCQNTRGGRKCYCGRGFNLARNGKSCIEITCPERDVVKPNHGRVERTNGNKYESRLTYICDHGYQNTGTSELICGDEGKWGPREGGYFVPPRCVDVNECDLANGGCEHTCANFEGGSECSCLNGYQLEDDGYHCKDIDECADDSTNECEHDCVNVESSFYCVCPEGYQIDLLDGKSCRPINCTGLYHPTRGRVTAVGSDTDCTTRDVVKGTKCRYTCEDGYEPVEPAARRVVEGDIVRECRTTGSWSEKRIECSPRKCPPLTLPDHALVYPLSCREQAKFGKRCTVSCGTNYRLRGEAVTTCTNVGSPGDVNIDWSPEDWTCVEDYPEPYVVCPDDVNMELGPGESHVIVNLTSPQSNYPTTIDGDYVLGENNFTIGQTKVVFTAHGHNDETATCTLRVRILDTEPPTVRFCPESQVIETAESAPVVSWEDPVFVDNVGLKSTTHIVEPNRPFTWGIYYVKYTASDEHRNFADCVFTIHVKKKECKELVQPANGDLSCDSWFLGKFCQLSCNAGFAPFEEDATDMYTCNQEGVWRPTSRVPDCVEVSEQIAEGLGKMCRPGSVTKQRRGKTVCVSCPSGTSWAVTTGGPKCVNCPVGTYQTETGQTVCNDCPNGTNTTEAGVKREEHCYGMCPPGTFSDTGLGPECVSCRQGFYQPLAGQTTCLWCPKNTNTTSDGTVSEDDCVAPPRVLSHGLFRQVQVENGQKVTMDCHARGRPLPSVTWVRDGSEDILNLEEVEGEDDHEDHKIVRLTIDEMRAEDEGLYKCVATNIAGSHDRKVTISIAEEDEE
ncbi:HMCN1 [Branchiostoma lanceolatum]|uniref:HMCN1 protein n=1 Tax=Branchiostoma lanceolatum TaxID=7740 RepID=A0A8J9YRD5_BRALA|nr:HMCN1 [Branchiostoma lanceolatum]